MAFVGFDLDETLGTFIGPDPFLHFLEPQKFSTNIISERLSIKLNIAFNWFAKALLSMEPSLGILRPGIIDICRKLLKLKNKGIIKSIIIYSNNGNTSCLRLAARMIEIALHVPEGSFFCNRVHWNHQLRLRKVNNSVKENNPQHSFWLKDSYYEIKTDRPGVGVKSIHVLKDAFRTGSCNIDSKYIINNSDILFFDDLIHPNIYNAIGREHYFNVNRYSIPYNFEIIMKCFTAVMNKNNDLFNDSEYISYIKNIIPTDNTININTIINKIIEIENSNKLSLRSNKYTPWINDTSDILERLNTIYNIKETNNTNAANKTLNNLKFQTRMNLGIGTMENNLRLYEMVDEVTSPTNKKSTDSSNIAKRFYSGTETPENITTYNQILGELNSENDRSVAALMRSIQLNDNSKKSRNNSNFIKRLYNGTATPENIATYDQMLDELNSENYGSSAAAIMRTLPVGGKKIKRNNRKTYKLKRRASITRRRR